MVKVRQVRQKVRQKFVKASSEVRQKFVKCSQVRQQFVKFVKSSSEGPEGTGCCVLRIFFETSSDPHQLKFDISIL